MSSSSNKPSWRTAKRRADEYAREWEADEKRGLSVAKRHSRLFSASKVAGAHSRRDHDQDAAIFQAVVASVRRGNGVCFGRGRQSLVTKGSSFFPEHANEGEDGRGRPKHTIWTPDWSHTGDRLKMLSFAHVTSVDGAMAFTLDLTHAVVEAGLASPRGFVGYISDRIVRELKREGFKSGTWAFAVEASPIHDPHIHGVVGMGDVKALRDALYRAGGRNEPRTGREVDLTPIKNLMGWIEYVTKAPLVTRRALSRASLGVAAAPYTGGVLGASRDVRGAAARWYRETRATGLPIDAVHVRTTAPSEEAS